MSLGKIGTVVSLVFLILLPLPKTASASPDAPEPDDLTWAYGTIVDSVTVTGNTNTRPFAILREMQTQPGSVLEKKAIQRDIRFITDLSSIAQVDVRADSLSPGHTAIRIRVNERSAWLTKSILPRLSYNFETGLTYGLRGRDKNFRGRLESFSVTYERNEKNDNWASIGWSSSWMGWRHISVGAGMRYFNRGRPPSTDQRDVLENAGGSVFVSFPLTQSRMRFRQIETSVSLDKTRTGGLLEPLENDVLVSPQIGYRFDSRDSGVRPNHGGTFYVGLGQSIPVSDGRGPFYRLRNEIRLFRSTSKRTVLALLSNVFYQFGEFPELATIGLGGGRTLRGYPERRFAGYHRWYGTVEWRYMILPRKVFRLPIIKEFDVGLGLVSFLDGGIVWNRSSDFTFDNLHGTGGFGIRFYSPIQDVLRLDFGLSLQGEARFAAGTGIRF